MLSIFDAIHHKIVPEKQRIVAHFGEDVSLRFFILMKIHKKISTENALKFFAFSEYLLGDRR